MRLLQLILVFFIPVVIIATTTSRPTYRSRSYVDFKSKKLYPSWEDAWQNIIVHAEIVEQVSSQDPEIITKELSDLTSWLQKTVSIRIDYRDYYYIPSSSSVAHYSHITAIRCGLPPDHRLTIEGVEANLTFLVHVYENPKLKTPLEVNGTYCQLGKASSHRPSAGIITIQFKDEESLQDTDLLRSLLRQAALTVMAFDWRLTKYFEETTMRVYRGWADLFTETKKHDPKENCARRTNLAVIDPRVVEAARSHFNCSTISKIEVEEALPTSKNIIRWETTLLAGDVMAPKVRRNATVSNVTLAFLEAAGWYKTNRSQAVPSNFGFGRGCDFVEYRCYGKTRYLQEFCSANCASNQNSLCTIDEFTNGCAIKELSYDDSDHPCGRISCRDEVSLLSWHGSNKRFKCSSSKGKLRPVSYTHLTLPTIYSV
eukprot:TRINITY_DN2599_c0_g1_i1.p1 TRINITY_DN2599_c0_g1~~TRINITY_DN2599_c0_g1_i1.p1  ORF type:complete len:428 (-),score=52.50 TRINITY_DN2599_c0_g1_i1:36-1319(-)